MVKFISGARVTTRFLNIFKARQILSAYVLSLMLPTFGLTVFLVEQIAYGATRSGSVPAAIEAAPADCAQILNHDEGAQTQPIEQLAEQLPEQLTLEEISQHVDALAAFYLDLFHGPEALQKTDFLLEGWLMSEKFSEFEFAIPDIQSRVRQVVLKRLPQFKAAMEADDREKADRLRESEERTREIQKLHICNRTPQVRDAIMHHLGVKNCEEVTIEDLKKITELNLNGWDNSTGEISVLNEYDFYGLSSLKSLNLAGNRLLVLPEGVFAGLSSLKKLSLSHNQFSTLPEGVFAGLNSLETLDLYNNQLLTLPDGVFAGLSSLMALYLSNNQLLTLPEGVFAGLSSLEALSMFGNQLSTLPEGVFVGLSSLKTLYLSHNPNFNFEIDLLKNLKAIKDLSLPVHLENSSVEVGLRKLFPRAQIRFY